MIPRESLCELIHVLSIQKFLYGVTFTFAIYRDEEHDLILQYCQTVGAEGTINIHRVLLAGFLFRSSIVLMYYIHDYYFFHCRHVTTPLMCLLKTDLI